MKKIEGLPNLGENILSVSGSQRGVRITLIGEKHEIIGIMKIAMKTSSTVREIMSVLTNVHSEEQKA